MIDLGRKSTNSGEVASTKSGQKKIYYPSFYVDKDLGIKETDVGSVITATVKLKINRVSKEVNAESVALSNKETYSCNFDVMGIELEKKSLDELEREEFEKNPVGYKRRRR
jgi:hypothetical protein